MIITVEDDRRFSPQSEIVLLVLRELGVAKEDLQELDNA